MRSILDASVVIADIRNAPIDREVLLSTLDSGPLMAANSFSEVAAFLLENGVEEPAIYRLIDAGQITIVPLTEQLAFMTAELLSIGKPFGLSLADRSCLATAIALDVDRIVTTDRAWLQLPEPYGSRIVNARPD